MKADIFFVVTTAAVFVVTGVAAWVTIYMIKILRNVEDISETVKNETKKLSHDLDGVRERVKKTKGIPRMLTRWIGRAAKK